MNDDEKQEVYGEAISMWGEFSQMMMAIEEMAELTQELAKVYRGKLPGDDLRGEIADVRIMLEQLILIFDKDGRVDELMNTKLDRLAYRIENGAWPNTKEKIC